MNYLKVFLLLLCSSLFSTLFAQSPHKCANSGSAEQVQRLLKNKKYIEEHGVSRSVVKYVPIQYHLIADFNGEGRIAEKAVLEMHCYLNEIFAEDDAGLQFFIHDEFNYINDNELYESPSSQSSIAEFNSLRVDNTINIFFPKEVTDDFNFPNDNDFILVGIDNLFNLYIGHHVGHYFSLLHTFNGWDYDPYNAATHGIQVQEYSPGGVLNEKMDGSNCEDAGDFICDTPPSYLFWPWGNCDYNGGAQDPNGVLVDPDENNIMDYFEDCTQKQFSPQQKAIMRADYDQRPELHVNWSPGVSITDQVQIITPVDESITSGFDQIFFEWEPVAGAESYLLEIDRLSSFDFDPTFIVVTNTEITVSGIFEPENTYRWRVTPFNQINTCTFAPVNKFTTPLTVGNKNISEITDWSINPNPVSLDQLTITMDSPISFDAEITLLSNTGQTLKTMQYRFNSGESDVAYSVAEIPNGIYFLTIKSGAHLINKKIIVTK